MEKNHVKILFISFYNDEAYGLRILHSIICRQGYDAEMLFLKLNDPRKPLTEEEKRLLYEKINDFKPHVLAFGLVSPNFGLYKQLYKTIRGLGDFKILIGGWQASLNPEETIKYCDLLCRGEGEEAITEVMEAVAAGRDFENIKNIWYNSGNAVVKNPVRALIPDLSKYPVCMISNSVNSYIEDNALVKADPYTINKRYGTAMGRGCPFSCTYCSNSYMEGELYPRQWSRIRYRDIDHVIGELAYVKSMMPALEKINFYDELFMPKPEWAKVFFERYKKEVGLPFYCMFYPGTCREELILMMKEAGLGGVWVGVQSGSARVRKEIFKRNYTNEAVLAQASLLAKYGISARYDFIFDNPFETPDEKIETIKLMAALPEPRSFNFFSLKYFPHTQITEMALNANIITAASVDDQLEIVSPEYEVSREQRERILRSIEEMTV